MNLSRPTQLSHLSDVSSRRLIVRLRPPLASKLDRVVSLTTGRVDPLRRLRYDSREAPPVVAVGHLKRVVVLTHLASFELLNYGRPGIPVSLLDNRLAHGLQRACHLSVDAVAIVGCVECAVLPQRCNSAQFATTVAPQVGDFDTAGEGVLVRGRIDPTVVARGEFAGELLPPQEALLRDQASLIAC